MTDIAHSNGPGMARAIKATALAEAGPWEAKRILAQPLSLQMRADMRIAVAYATEDGMAL